MKKYFTYQWSALHLNTKCSRCGNNIVLQNFDEPPTCNECGNINKTSWETIIKTADIIGMIKGNSNKKTMLGPIDATLSIEKVEEVHCYYCKHELTITDQDPLNNYACGNCKKQLLFKEFNSMEDMVFYKSGNTSLNNDVSKMIAVRCVSCGAPLEADPTKTNFTCKFCSTENILPMSLRYKVVLDDVFVGERQSRFPKLLDFEQDGKVVKQTLRENGKASFADAELNKVLINKKDDASVYHMIVDEFNYLPPDSVLRELFQTSKNQTIVNLTGTRLQKSPEEIVNRIAEFSPRKPEKKITEKVFYANPKRPNFYRSPLLIIILMVVILVALLVIRTI